MILFFLNTIYPFLYSILQNVHPKCLESLRNFIILEDAHDFLNMPNLI